MNESSTELIEGRAAYQNAVTQLIQLAKQDIALYTVRLPALDYANSDTIEALRNWLTSDPGRGDFRILVKDSRAAMSEPNALINLALRMTSYVHFRDLPKNILPVGDMLIVDGRHLLKRPQSDARTATLYLDSPLQAHEELKQFNQWWEEATPSAEIRNRNF